MVYTYYVVFETSAGHGAMTVMMNQRISSDNLTELVDNVREYCKDDDALIKNWILLDSPEYPSNTKESVLEFSALVKGKLASLINSAIDNPEKKKAYTLAINAVLEAEREYL